MGEVQKGIDEALVKADAMLEKTSEVLKGSEGALLEAGEMLLTTNEAPLEKTSGALKKTREMRKGIEKA